MNTNQGDDTMNKTQWRRPAACNTDQATGNCYEVATAGDAVGVRSSQHPDDIAIDTREAFAEFVQACKNGEYDDLT